jgi:hypothetical protein
MKRFLGWRRIATPKASKEALARYTEQENLIAAFTC